MLTRNHHTPVATNYRRFDSLRTMLYAAPLKKADFIELQHLAEQFDPKMAKYLKDNASMLCC